MYDTLANLKTVNIIQKADIVSFDPNDKHVTQANSKKNILAHLQVNADSLNVYKFTYLSNDQKVVGFLVQPKSFLINQNQEIRKKPCIIYNRGGSQGYGFIDQVALFGKKIGDLALQGYTVIATQYSGCGGSEGLDEYGGRDLYDVLNLKIILDQLDCVDITRIGMYGHSRGGLMTYMCVSQVDWIEAAVVGSAHSDMQKQIQERPDLRLKTATMFDNTSVEELNHRSPIKWPEKFCQNTPILIIHGTSDSSVLASHSLELATKLYENKKMFRLLLLEGGNHALTNFDRVYTENIRNWFDRYLGQDRILPNLEI